MDAQHIVELFVEIVGEVRDAIHEVDEWGPSGGRDGQYTIDVRADEVVVRRLREAGFGVLSEESGVEAGDRPLLAVVDPIDGSTNAAAGLPWYATSLCALDEQGPLAAVVVNQATRDRWHAIRGGGAFRNGRPIAPSRVTRLDEALIAVSGLPPTHLGWRQFRCFGAAALDLCAVADGTFDAYADLSVDAHGSWDYLGGWLVLREAGGVIVDRHGRELVTRLHGDRRTPIAACTPTLCDDLVGALEG